MTETSFWKQKLPLAIVFFLLGNFVANVLIEVFWLRGSSGELDVPLMFSWAAVHLFGDWFNGSLLGWLLAALALCALVLLVLEVKWRYLAALGASALILLITAGFSYSDWSRMLPPRPSAWFVVGGNCGYKLIQIACVIFAAAWCVRAMASKLETAENSAFQSRRSLRGMTLVELLIVIAILGVLAAILFPVLGSAMKAGKWSADAQEMHQIYLGVAMYTQDQGGYPPDLTYTMRYVKSEAVYASALDHRSPFPNGQYPIKPFSFPPNQVCGSDTVGMCVDYKLSYPYLVDNYTKDGERIFGMLLPDVLAVPACGLISDPWKLAWHFGGPLRFWQFDGGMIQMVCVDGHLKKTRYGFSNGVDFGMLFFDQMLQYQTDQATCGGTVVN